MATEKFPSLPFDDFALNELYQRPQGLPDTLNHPYDTSIRLQNAQLPDYGTDILDVRRLNYGHKGPHIDEVGDGTTLRGTFRLLSGGNPHKYVCMLESTTELQVSNRLFVTDLLTRFPLCPESETDRELGERLAAWRGLLSIVADVDVGYMELENGSFQPVGRIIEVFAAELPMGHPHKKRPRPEQSIIVSGAIKEYGNGSMKLAGASSPDSPETIEHIIDVGSGIKLLQPEFVEHSTPTPGDIVHVRAYKDHDGSLSTFVTPGMMSSAVRDHRICQIHALKGSEERTADGLNRILDFNASIETLKSTQSPEEFRKVIGDLFASRFDPALARMGGFRGYEFSNAEANALRDIHQNYWPKEGEPLALLVGAESYQGMRSGFNVNLYGFSLSEFQGMFDQVIDGEVQPTTKHNGIRSLFTTFSEIAPYRCGMSMAELFLDDSRMNSLLQRVETDDRNDINTAIVGQLLLRTDHLIQLKSSSLNAQAIMQAYEQVIGSLSNEKLKKSGLARIIASRSNRVLRAVAGLKTQDPTEQFQSIENPKQCAIIAKKLPAILDSLRNVYPPAINVELTEETIIDLEFYQQQLDNEASQQIAKDIAETEELLARVATILNVS
ncbi:MAG TPA: hypothetical protein VF733_02745 [Candidatus Saccharimonadales bacterium]